MSKQNKIKNINQCILNHVRVSKKNSMVDVDDFYVIEEKIGSGSFGEVYIARHKKGNCVAAKVEEKKNEPRMMNEYKIYYYLNQAGFKTGLPRINLFLQTSEYNFMFMQLLGPNLEDLFNKLNRKFQLSTVLTLADQILQLLQQMHNAHFIHRDIKPNNFMIGRDANIGQLYVIDFGLSQRFIKDGKHIKFRDKRSLIGTARYASLNMHLGIEPTRRDDLESLGYILVYFLKGSLPWQGIKKQQGIDHIEEIGKIKNSTSIKSLCSDLHKCFSDYLEYCTKLKFDETPNYLYLRKLFQDARKELNLGYEFEWVTNTDLLLNNDKIDKIKDNEVYRFNKTNKAVPEKIEMKTPKKKPVFTKITKKPPLPPL